MSDEPAIDRARAEAFTQAEAFCVHCGEYYGGVSGLEVLVTLPDWFTVYCLGCRGVSRFAPLGDSFGAIYFTAKGEWSGPEQLKPKECGGK